MTLNVHQGSVRAKTLQQLLATVTSAEGDDVSASRPSVCQDFCSKFRSCKRFRSGGTPPIEGFCDHFEELPDTLQVIDQKALAICRDNIAQVRARRA